jgi:aldehyde dehydrogenase (NAD+)
MRTIDAARVFIGGQFQIAKKTRPVIEAATESHLGDGANATEAEIDAEIDAAVHAARSALDEWSSTSPEQRAELLGRFGAALRSRAQSTSALISRENGLPISMSHPTNGVLPPALLEYYAALALQASAEELRPNATGHTIVRPEPVG